MSLFDILNKFFRKSSHSIKNQSSGSIEKILADYTNKATKAFFVQIGSNNGVNNDPLHSLIVKGKLTGILIEPVKEIFDSLVENYKHQQELIFENVAISDTNGTRKFYRLKETSDPLPSWYNQLGSFLPEVILKHKTEISNIEDYLICEQITCLTFDSLVEKHKIRRVDIIHIDTEGYDFEIIKTINLNLYNPNIIIFEHKHLSVSDYQECIAYLKKLNYKLFKDGNDTIAVRKPK